MKIAERLCGAVIAALAVAAVMAQVEVAASSSGSTPAPAPVQHAAKAATDDIIVVAFPEQQIVTYMADYASAAEQRSEGR